jgi:hypothetical protein
MVAHALAEPQPRRPVRATLVVRLLREAVWERTTASWRLDEVWATTSWVAATVAMAVVAVLRSNRGRAKLSS